MGKKKVKIPTVRELRDRLFTRYDRWVHIFNQGCSDPTWSDGVNINLVKNHISYEKAEIEKVLGNNYIVYPDEYFYPEPIELPEEFMAVDRKSPILAGFMKLESDIVPSNRFGYIKLSQVMPFDWKEALN